MSTAPLCRFHSPEKVQKREKVYKLSFSEVLEIIKYNHLCDSYADQIHISYYTEAGNYCYIRNNIDSISRIEHLALKERLFVQQETEHEQIINNTLRNTKIFPLTLKEILAFILCDKTSYLKYFSVASQHWLQGDNLPPSRVLLKLNEGKFTLVYLSINKQDKDLPYDQESFKKIADYWFQNKYQKNNDNEFFKVVRFDKSYVCFFTPETLLVSYKELAKNWVYCTSLKDKPIPCVIII